jgi:hypothetical protein
MRTLVRELRAALGVAARPAFVVTVWVVFMGVAAAVAVGSSRLTILAACIFAVAALLGAFVLGTAIPPLLADARTLCLPGRFPVLSYAGTVMGIFCLAGLVVPGAWLGWQARSTVPAVLIGSGALAGLLIPRMPRATMAAIWVLVIVQAAGVNFGQWLAGSHGMLDPRNQLVFMFVALALANAWSWRPILRGDAAALDAAARLSRRSAGGADAQGLARHSDASFAVARLSGRRGSAAGVIRVFLGAPYAPLSLRVQVRLVMQLAFVAVPLAAWASWRLSWHTGWRVGIMAWLAFAWLTFAARLPVLRHVNGERAELTLLPGLGDARAQRRALYRASLGPPLAIIAAAVPLAAAAALRESAALPAIIAAGFWLVSTVLLGVSYIAAVLAKSTAPRVYGAWAALLAAMLAIWWLNGSAANLIVPGPVGWILYLPVAWAAGAIVIYARRLASFPHPLVLP